jgi:hypothetical protein
LAVQIHHEKYGSTKNSTRKQREECRKLAAIHLNLL